MLSQRRIRCSRLVQNFFSVKEVNSGTCDKNHANHFIRGRDEDPEDLRLVPVSSVARRKAY